MFIFKRVQHIRDWVESRKADGLKVGFVPTMGALHYGHLSLVEKSKEETDVTVVSIFVNPKQFNDPEDLHKYPRPIEADLKMLYEGGVDMVFLPEVEDIYPPGDHKTIDFDPGPAAERMEGKFRPGHFIGMSEVVYRLLSITTPDSLFMGQKDFQQFAIIRKLITDFHMPIQLVMCTTVREANGLAMSSRNVRLSAEARDKAGIIFNILSSGKMLFEQRRPAKAVQEIALDALRKVNFDPEYFEIVNGYTLEPVQSMQDADQIVVCCAVKVEGIRLIDNMIWK
ncbi:MAG: pantoate--beta-alanine ligase [Saprospiraceae bacterium]|nr:pantoate--beta-alanine ligase [Saprospiraceae bacterium]